MANNYSWLKKETEPKVIVNAVKLIGIKEVAGSRDNPDILNWAETLELQHQYHKDDIAWCGLYVAYVCHVSGKDLPDNPLWAKNWLNWGVAKKIAMLGDVLVFKRDGGGHVGFYVGEDEKHYHVLGGNQSDMVCITRIRKERCIGIRRTKWKIAQPQSVRMIFLEPTGIVTENEA